MRQRSGFTLIELSIVLVIIGLLVGGILSAQSMISASHINAFVRQTQQFDIAVDCFQTRFNGIPGDASNFSGVLSSGTGCSTTGGISGCTNNGYVDDQTGYQNGIGGEMAEFWHALSLSGCIKVYSPASGASYSNDFTHGVISVGASANSPKSKLGDGSFIVWGGGYTAGNNYVLINGSESFNQTITPNVNTFRGAVGGKDALSVDFKVDDGISNSGNVKAYEDDGTPLIDKMTPSNDAPYHQIYVFETEYMAANYNSGNKYGLKIKMGLTSGQAQ